LVELKDWTGTIKMDYDKVGNLTKVTDHNGKTTGYSYDANGNNTGIAYPDGSAVGYTYDKNNRMTKVVDAEQQVTQYAYDSAGNTLQMQQPGATTSYTYNKNGLPIQILQQMKDGTQMEDNLTYDAIGNILSSVKKGSTSALTEDETYSYDAIGQLLSYTKGQNTESYTYDMLGNMTEKSVNGNQEATYQYNALNQLTNKTENGITYSYRYDKRGNQIEEMCGDQVTRKYIYDATNHMVLGRNSENGEKSEYVYNGLSKRVKNVQKLEQTDSSYENYEETAVGKNKQAFRTKETNYVIDYLSDTNNDILSYETGFGATRVTYGRGSERLSQNVTIYPETPKSTRTDIAKENNGKSYFQTDRLGSALFASNQEGEVLRYADRDAWGNLQIPMQEDMNSAGIEDSFGFTNYNYDQVLDQYFAQARFYDAKQGRMLAVDPVNTGLNRYLYCKNDPLNYIDPLGATAKNVKAGVSISKKGIATAAATALTGYKKALSSVGNIGNAGSSFANTSKCSSNKGTGKSNAMYPKSSYYTLGNFNKGIGMGLVDDYTGNQFNLTTGKGSATTKGTGKQGYQNSTMNLIMKLEGTPFLKPRINNNGTITIGYGYDFTKESDPDIFNKYLKVDSKGNIKVTGKMSNEDAGATIKKVADKLGITSALDDFIKGKGFGNKVKPLLLNQNQYDALFSYFYSNGKNVFSNSKYNEWIGYGGEYANRAKERKELRDYLINNNENYNSNMIIDLFVNSKGANIKYDYKDRRENEASVFNQK